MAIEDLGMQLQTVDAERWAYMLAAKVTDIESSVDEVQARGELEGAIDTFSALRCIAEVVSKRFAERNKGILEDLQEEPEEDLAIDDDERAGIEEAVSYCENMYNFGIALSCIAVVVLTEPEEAYFPLTHAVTRPDLVEAALGELDEEEVAAAAEAVCDKILDDEEGPVLHSLLSAEYSGVSDIGTVIGLFAVNSFDDGRASMFASAGSSTMFAALKNVIDAGIFKQQFSLGD